MKKPLLFVTMLTGLTAAFVVAPMGDSAAAPPVAVKERAPVQRVDPPPAIRPIGKLEAKNAAAVPGETRNVEATLTSGANAIAGKTVSFQIEGNDPMTNKPVLIKIGAAQTNAQGKATVAWKVPELGQAPYTLKAVWAGDDSLSAASDTANFGVIKGITKFEVSYHYGHIDSHTDGSKFGSIIISLRRQSDSAMLSKTYHLTVNGSTRDITITNGMPSTILLQPTNAPSWNVSLQYDGDAANQATAFTKTYTKPAGQ